MLDSPSLICSGCLFDKRKCTVHFVLVRLHVHPLSVVFKQEYQILKRVKSVAQVKEAPGKIRSPHSKNFRQ
ncbi:hypothetical protein AALO_G00018950 [Alosa alosa]|uniref:Uncharacterized protein n=1 Tax=Alosa alosa TaxID=278164 RepID=A0AAV6HKG9_9TELE|nr:hypothetical protein AALO_G00018950 [Alosa alosa]